MSSRAENDQRINVNDDAEMARWANSLCTSEETLREAIAAVGPRLDDVKRYMFAALLRKASRSGDD